MLQIKIDKNATKNVFIKKWENDNHRTSMTPSSRDVFNQKYRRIKKNLSELYGCEQLDLILQKINDTISDTIDQVGWQKRWFVLRARSVPKKEITRIIEQEAFRLLGSHDMILEIWDKVDDGGGIYIPEVDLCISGHYIRTRYAPSLARGQLSHLRGKGDDEIPEDIWMKIKTILNDNDYVNEEVMKVRKLDDEIRLREKPLPPRPDETEQVKLYEKEHL